MVEPLRRGAWLLELSEAGATFNYPDALTPTDWLCLIGVRRGFKQYEKEELEKPPKT